MSCRLSNPMSYFAPYDSSLSAVHAAPPQIVDCAWDYGPNGCFGGYYQPVFNYIAESGGIALEQDYSYRSEVGFCRSANHSLVGRFSGYWAVESRNELALMEAVWKYGPVAVSVDAGTPYDAGREVEAGWHQPGCERRSGRLGAGNRTTRTK
ncbi:hypothetical protein Vafri_14119 [Volvox africanus]|uniref:Peptidase C1A papain C-terminal domain-containing protein n=1 Tax=Volvox africanus TaxID=51714 RepID=A0A8J4BF49_9CHLO|nr:hypothetical protein Vafri_14119 [Volvox africanus]